jgi:deoxycytidylate deaminase
MTINYLEADALREASGVLYELVSSESVRCPSATRKLIHAMRYVHGELDALLHCARSL